MTTTEKIERIQAEGKLTFIEIAERLGITRASLQNKRAGKYAISGEKYDYAKSAFTALESREVDRLYSEHFPKISKAEKQD